MLAHDYNAWLVATSVVIVIVDAYMSLSVIGRVVQSQGLVRLVWLVLGALAMGLGVWAMHFVAMMAWQVRRPLDFAVMPTLLSLLPIVFATGVVLHLSSYPNLGTKGMLSAGIVLGLGIIGGHAIGMTALHMEPPLMWHMLPTALSAAVALAGSVLAMWLGARVARQRQRSVRVRQRMLSSIVMGSTVAASHYLGMAGVSMAAGARSLTTDGIFAGSVFGLLLTIVALGVLLVTLGVAIVHGRIQYHARQMQVELDQARSALHALAYHDVLTGLPNRAMMMDTLRQLLPSAETEPVALMFIDLDGFKAINDSLGHEAGDTFLRAVADALRSSVRARDTVARFGGDEFVVVLERFRGEDNLIRICHKILELVSRPVTVCGHPVLVSPSIGVAMAPRDGADAATLLRNADAAMYAVKETGKADFRFYEPGMHEQASERLALTLELRNAIKGHEFCLEYQTKWDLRTQRMCGVEALARWRHPTRGNVPPSVFIPLAERSGMVTMLGERVLDDVLEQISRWQMADIDVGYVAINLSLHELRRPSFARHVYERVIAKGIDPSRIRFEITESATVGQAELLFEQLQELYESGFALLADDFGMGYSNLAYLRQLPVGAIKIDQSFVRGSSHNEADREIAEALIALAKRLRIETVAEGVETAEQVAWLRELGCDVAQGFYFSRPLPPDELLMHLRHGARFH